MAQMAEAAAFGGVGGPGDTFLTDMLLKGGTNPGRKNSGAVGKKSGKATFQTANKPSKMRANS